MAVVYLLWIIQLCAVSVTDHSHPPHSSPDPASPMNEMTYSIVADLLPSSSSHGTARAQSPHRPHRQ